MKSVKSAALFVSAFTVLGIGCGGDKAARKDAEGGPEFAMARRKAPPKPVDPGASMTLDNEIGVHGHRRRRGDAAGALRRHPQLLRARGQGAAVRGRQGPAALHGHRQRHGAGRLGARVVARQLRGRALPGRGGPQDPFQAPNGNKATTFEYPVEFRSQARWRCWTSTAPRSSTTSRRCCRSSRRAGGWPPSGVTAIMYIEPNGFPGSVGLATAAALDESAGGCVVQTIRTGACRSASPATSCAQLQHPARRRERRGRAAPHAGAPPPSLTSRRSAAAQLRVLAAVEAVDDEPDRHPAEQADERARPSPVHDVERGAAPQSGTR